MGRGHFSKGSHTSALSTTVKLWDWGSATLLNGQDWAVNVFTQLRQELLMLQGFNPLGLDLEGMTYQEVNRLAGGLEQNELDNNNMSDNILYFVEIQGDSWSVPVIGAILMGIVTSILPGARDQPVVPLSRASDRFPGIGSDDESCESEGDISSLEEKTSVPDHDFSCLALEPKKSDDAICDRCFQCTKEIAQGFHCAWQVTTKKEDGGWEGYRKTFHPDCFLTFACQTGQEQVILEKITEEEASQLSPEVRRECSRMCAVLMECT